MLARPFLVVVSALAFLWTTASWADHEDDGILIAPSDIVWKDGPASLAKGSQMAVLEGDPSKPGPFLLRLKLPDGFRVMPHTHPKDERVTVLAGTLYLGHG